MATANLTSTVAAIARAIKYECCNAGRLPPAKAVARKWGSEPVSEPGWPFRNRPTPTKLWSVWKTGRLMECEINAHPLGHEVRVYLQGDFHWSRALPTLEDAVREAENRRRELLAEGWTDRPSTCS